jgi:hypothetical protein
MSMDQLLYVVDWDTGQTTRHYFGDLLVISPFETLHDFEQALLSGVCKANLTLGPQGGFRQAVVEVEAHGQSIVMQFEQTQRKHWEEVVRPIIERAGVPVVEARMPKKEVSKKR